ncbi:hypothetical protein [Nocardioides terrigena]|uniref:hypothetical protein n=1 Tax=Nocardioides terrigena TaxID=424797 RepID=UPI000D2F5BC4|nr:hypothetical protein [Nocardioides terrigena]
MTELLWRAPARLSLSGPAGWTPAQRVEVYHRDGDALVRVETWPVDPSADLDTLAAAHAGVPQDAEDPEDGGIRVADVLGSVDGRQRVLTWTDPAGGRRTATLSYVLEGGRMVAVSVVVPTSDPDKAEQASAITASLSRSSPLDLPTEGLPLRPSSIDHDTLRASWLAGSDPDTGPWQTITVEESFAAARHFGVPMLPGADTASWSVLDPAQRDLAAAVAWRSLQARGAEDDPVLREALELAAGHDVIVVLSTGGDSPTTRWLAARPDRSVEVAPGARPGVIRLRSFATAGLADLVLATTPAGAEVNASSVYRADGRLLGRETRWTADTDDGDVVRRGLADLLPPDPLTGPDR